MDILGVPLPEGRSGKAIAIAVIAFPVVAVVAVGAYVAYRRFHPRPETDEETVAHLESVHRTFPRSA